MKNELRAQSTIIIEAPVHEVWAALINPVTIKKYMHGMEAISEWKAGSTLVWIGKPDEKEEEHAKGTIIKIETEKTLQYTFFFPGYGLPDEDNYYNRVEYTVTQASPTETKLSVSQGDFSVFPNGETYLNHSQSFWTTALSTLKSLLENKK
jgi:uncharacterized protein YndB with AHSA1/START domain